MPKPGSATEWPAETRASLASMSVFDRRASPGDHRAMKSTSFAGKVVTLVAVAIGISACYVEAQGPVECRTRFHRRHDVEVCRTRCGDEGCRTHCQEEERWSREHHCWAE
jgi:hypothetical protein